MLYELINKKTGHVVRDIETRGVYSEEMTREEAERNNRRLNDGTKWVPASEKIHSRWMYRGQPVG